jgi:LmbE family N-acetylglucosaminyl deacetylase
VQYVLSTCLAFFLAVVTLAAQGPRKPNSAEILNDIQKLNVLGSVLYVAAHPDDENTRLIAWLSKEKHYEVTYISLTRGDGGQNLIGTELREQLGVLRSEELLMARSIDGGKQAFSRANDFGYSKNPAETFRIWDKDLVMEDLLLTMRTSQPDVVINRFSHEDKFSTHGHHTASAMLSVEAFDLAAKADIYPKQAAKVGLWQPQRLFLNTSWFFYGSREAFDKVDKSQLHTVDVGSYLPLLGKSVTEIAAEARSQHKCQGFGMLSNRGSNLEYLEHVKGSKPMSKTDLFAGINTTWTRVAGGAPIGKLLSKIAKSYNPAQPDASVPALIKALKMMEALPEGYWKTVKIAELKQVIKSCLGLYLEASTSESSVAHLDSLAIHFEAINRSAMLVQLKSITCSTGAQYKPDSVLRNNQLYQANEKVMIGAQTPITAPYWLIEPWTTGMYKVTDEALRCLPETPRAVTATWEIMVAGHLIRYTEAAFYKKGEPAIGEVFEPIDVLPAACVSFDRQALYSTKQTETIKVRVQSTKANINGAVRIKAPQGWVITPAEHTFEVKQKGGNAEFVFAVTPLANAQRSVLTAEVVMDGKVSSQSLNEIRYGHIPTQQVLLPAQLTYTPLQIKCTAKTVGYVMGAGDEVPKGLEQIGCAVTLLKSDDIVAEKLAKYDCVLVGIRAYNTRDELKFLNAALLAYVANGGTLIVQYNTTGELVLNDFAPYKLKLGRDRVTEEDAPVTMLEPRHSLLNTPNQIQPSDFDGWAQERGLYFPKEWGPEFAPIISCKDHTETTELTGSILIADYGKGKYIYTGISFFRELPEGVPGAMRLLANLMSAGKGQ